MNVISGTPKRKKESTTSCSDLDSSAITNSFSSLNETTEETEPVNKSLKDLRIKNNSNNSKSHQKKQKSKKQKTAASPELIETNMEMKLEQKLDKIDEKLNNVLTKDDRSFIREIIKDTFEEMKEQLLGSVIKRLEILEDEIYNKSASNSKLNSEISENKRIIETRIEKSEEKMENELKILKLENEKLKENANDQEQYSRRNNLRITGIKEDSPQQSSLQTKIQFQKMCKDNLGLVILDEEIDIAHRIGQFKTGSHRPIIVKFVRRQTKINIMKNAKSLKGTRIYLNEDLTRSNQQVLMSLRLKDPKRIEKAWSFEGKVFAIFKSTNPLRPENTTTRQIKFSEYDQWLSLPWPAREVRGNSSENYTTNVWNRK